MKAKRKKNGSYYTPPFLASFVFNHIYKKINVREISILEPSVGDGEFIRALKTIKLQDNSKVSFTCVEKIKPEIDKAKLTAKSDKLKSIEFKFECADFLKWQDSKRIQYSLIIGNPPYIKKDLLNEVQVNSCRQIHNSANVPESAVKNIWSSFLIRCTQLLKPDGILALVLPAELLQAKFAVPLREFLKSNFERVETFTFSELLFDSIGQDTIVLIGYKKSTTKGIYYSCIESKEQLEKGHFTLKSNESLVKSDVKWTHHVLTSDEIEFLNKLKTQLNPISSYCSSKPGIVTAANDFFIIDSEIEAKYKLSSYAEPIIQKGLYVNGSVVFAKKDFNELCLRGLPTKVLRLDNKGQRSYSKKIQEYLREGIKVGIHKRYKSLQREFWFSIQNVSEPPAGFFFKRCHHYPKLLKNSAKVLVTDSAYEVTMKDDHLIEELIFSFYNSLSLCYAEMEGRYYGGGVLELTPKEFKRIPIPLSKISKKDFAKYTSFFENKSSINDVLHKFDQDILGSSLQLSTSEIEKLQSIKGKLISKRLRK